MSPIRRVNQSLKTIFDVAAKPNSSLQYARNQFGIERRGWEDARIVERTIVPSTIVAEGFMGHEDTELRAHRIFSLSGRLCRSLMEFHEIGEGTAYDASVLHDADSRSLNELHENGIFRTGHGELYVVQGTSMATATILDLEYSDFIDHEKPGSVIKEAGFRTCNSQFQTRYADRLQAVAEACLRLN